MRTSSARSLQRLWSAGLSCLLALPALGLTLEGAITSGDDAPVAKAGVWLAMGTQVFATETDAKGRYRFDKLDTGTFDLVVYKEGFAFTGHSGFAAGGDQLDFHLSPGESVEVRVVSPDNLPVAGVRLSSLQLNGALEVPFELLREQGLEQPRSGDGGTLSIPGLAAGGFMRLLLRHPDYADLHVDYLAVRAEQPDLRLNAGERVAGRVMTPEGEPAAGAEVTAFRNTAGGQRSAGGAVSDPDGFYHLRLEPGAYLLSARHPDYAAPAPQQFEVRRDADNEAVLTLAEARTLSGRVLYPDGKPAPGLLVSFRTGDTITEEAFTGAQGGFTLRVAETQGMLLIAPPFGYVLADGLGGIPVDFQERNETSAGDIQLAERPRLRGIVRDAEGQPVPKALIRTLNLPDPERAMTGEDGRFEFMPLYLPEDGIVGFRAEHPLRFLRRDFVADLSSSQDIEVALEAYTPNEKPEEAPESGNNVAGLLGKPAPPWSIARWYNSEPHTLEDFKGKVVVAVFWGLFDDTPQGLDTLEELYTLHQLYRDTDDVAVIGIHDATSTEEEVQEFVEAWQIEFPIALDDPGFTTFGNYRITFIPHILLIGKDGKVAYSQPNEAILEKIKLLRR